jgi:hypothetical protein
MRKTHEEHRQRQKRQREMREEQAEKCVFTERFVFDRGFAEFAQVRSNTETSEGRDTERKARVVVARVGMTS